jgi:5'-nucleotidase
MAEPRNGSALLTIAQRLPPSNLQAEQALLGAVLVGVPMYSDAVGIIPVAEALLGKGVPLGTVLAFMMAVIALSLPEEPRVAAIVAHYAAQLDGVRRRQVGEAPAAISNITCRVGECALGSFIADAMRASVAGADVALMNAGGIRTGLPAGTITLGDVLTMLPFGNTVATLELSGADLRAAIANGLARAGAGAFPQVSGLRVTWNPTAAPEARLVALEVATQGGFVPLDPARRYRVVTNNFLRNGGDGYAMLRDRAIDPYDSGPGLDEVVANAITATGRFAPAISGRIVTP